MRQHLLKAAAVGGLSLTFSTAAMAYCGSQPSVNCQRPVAAPCAAPAPQMMAAPQGQTNCQTDFVIQNESDYVTDPVVIHNSQPMGHLRSVKLHNSPHVNIMRVHGQPQTVGLEDAPTGFTEGCHPSSTTYCRQQAPQAAQIQAPKPYIAPPLKEVKAPVKQHQYGSTELVRGTAYLPTSHVNRNYDDAVAVLNSGPIPARPAVNGGQVPHPSMFDNKLYIDNAPHAPRQVTFKKVNTTTWYPNHPNLQAHAPAQLGHAHTVQAQAAQWEKVSGPTMIGSLQATQVICRRPATPQQAVEMHPACTQQAPMGYAAPMMPAPMMPAPMMAPMMPAPMKTSHSSRYGSDY